MSQKPLFFTDGTVARIVGPEAAALLPAIHHASLEYGRDWRMRGGASVLTAEGCTRLADGLEERGQAAGAARLREALRNAQALPPPDEVGELVPVEHAEPDETAMAAASRSRRHASDVEASPFNAE